MALVATAVGTTTSIVSTFQVIRRITCDKLDRRKTPPLPFLLRDASCCPLGDVSKNLETTTTTTTRDPSSLISSLISVTTKTLLATRVERSFPTTTTTSDDDDHDVAFSWLSNGPSVSFQVIILGSSKSQQQQQQQQQKSFAT